MTQASDAIQDRAKGLLGSFLKDLHAAHGAAESHGGCGLTLTRLRANSPQIVVNDITPRDIPDTALLAIDAEELVAWLDRRVHNGVGLTSARCYRRWLASFLAGIGHPEAERIRSWIPPGSYEQTMAEDEMDAQQLSTSSAGSETMATNSRYLAYLEPDALSKLLEQLLSLNRSGMPTYTAGPHAALMFTVTMMTGVRPMEWPTARLLDSFFDPDSGLTLGPVLEVHTFKQSKRREDNPLREKRYLLLDRWPTTQLDRLRAAIQQVHATDDYEGFYNRVRMTLSRAWKRVAAPVGNIDGGQLKASRQGELEGLESPEKLSGDQGITLYTGRHIFAEETRRSGTATRFELAAMLGHSLLTNQAYYGPRKTGSGRLYDFVLPRPWPGDAEDIALWDHKVNPLRMSYMQSDLFNGHEQMAAALENESASDFYIR